MAFSDPTRATVVDASADAWPLSCRIPPGLHMPMVLVAAIAVRLPFVAGAGFPLGDGGLFAQIIDDVRACSFGLPAFTSYNGGAIPLCYPPLGFYLAALSGLPTLIALIWLPLLLSILVPCALLIVARMVLDSADGAFAAGLSAAFLPVPYWFGLEGGGLTRSLGLLLITLTVAALLGTYERPSPSRIALTGLTLAASLASHPEATLLMPVLVVTVVLARPSRVGFGILLKVVGVSAILLAPWLAVVLWRHGLGPWLAAFHEGEGLSSLGLAVRKIATWWFTAEKAPAPLAVLALLGVPVAFLKRHALLLSWLVVPVFLVPRNCRFWAAPALALLAGLALEALVFGGIERAARCRSAGIVGKHAVLIVLVVYGLVLARGWSGRLLLLEPLPEDDRQVLGWLAGQVAPGERIAATDCEPTGLSSLAEWAPYLARAENVLVPQGREWTGEASSYNGRSAAFCQALATDASALQAWFRQEPTVRWLVLGSHGSGDPRVVRTLVNAERLGGLRLALKRHGATVWRITSEQVR